MILRGSASYTGIMSIALLVSACGGGGGGGGQPQPQPQPQPPQPQTIAFATAGPVGGILGTTVTNTASGGGGTGAITYSSSNVSAVIVNTTTGATTAVGLGSATITANKSADANFTAAQATYVMNVQSADSVHAWVGEQTSEVFLPASANGKQFGRAKIANCPLLSSDLATCVNVDSTAINGTSIQDTKATLTSAAYYAIVDGTNAGVPVVVNTKRFSERIGHGAVFFKNRYWVIGGAAPVLPGPATPSTVHAPQSDVWSSADGKTWRLETANAAFGPRWLHQTLVYNNAIWILHGSDVTSGVGTREVWRSEDGVTWTQVGSTPVLPTIAWTASIAATVFNNAMWIVIAGQSYSSTDGITWTPRSVVGAIDGTTPREYASLTVYNGELWYIGGAKVVLVNPNPVVFQRFAQNDVWHSPDGISWTRLTPNAFTARQQHAAFVLNNRLWVFGGQTVSAGFPGPPTKDAWSTTDGVTWAQQSLDTEIDFSWLQAVVQQTDRVTLIGGVLRAYSNKVWQTTNGESWTELAPFDFAPNLLSRGAVFRDAMWLIGGGRMDGLDTNEIWRSSDGLTWSRVTTAGQIFSPRDSHRVLVFNDRLWVIGGWDFFTAEGGTETFNNEVWSSADGVTWTKHTPSGATFAPRAGHGAVVFNGRMWVVGGAGGSGDLRFNDVWSTADGVSWVLEQANSTFSPRHSAALVANNNALWLFAGTDTPDGIVPAVGLQDAWRSTDGRTWTQLPVPPFAARTEPAATVFNDRIYLTGGVSDDSYFGSTRYNDVWSTVDGMTWQEETPQAPFSGRNNPVLINYNSKLYLVGGFSVSRPHDVWRSSDGVNWSAAFSHPLSPP